MAAQPLLGLLLHGFLDCSVIVNQDLFLLRFFFHGLRLCDIYPRSKLQLLLTNLGEGFLSEITSLFWEWKRGLLSHTSIDFEYLLSPFLVLMNKIFPLPLLSPL
jgi:hypothetical protein